jgi:hypothetical protein
MKNKRYAVPLILLILFIFFSSIFIWFAISMSPGGRGNLSEEGQTVNFESEEDVKDSLLRFELKRIAIMLDFMKADSLKKITTDNGFKSLVAWSDTLRNKDFISDLSTNLSQFNVFNVTDYDTLITLSMGKSDMVLGATSGYLFLKKVDDELKIDQFRGGK